MTNQIVINIDLGKGERGQRRKDALLGIAKQLKFSWDGKPSIGRFICAMADAEIESKKELDDEETS